MMKAVMMLTMLAAATAIPTALTHEKDNVIRMFDAWKAKFSREYETLEEHAERLVIFTENAAIVKEHNAAGHPWELELNQYADMTNAEFTQRHMLRESAIGTDHSPATSRHTNTGAAPDSMDWRSATPALVGPVKDQAQCGSCWAFSTVASVEGQVAKKTGKYESLSEQALVDCVKDVVLPGSSQSCCDGCQGGLMDFGFEWLIKNEAGKDDSEASYGYTAKDGSCSFKTGSEASVGITGYSDISKGSESDLKDAAGTVGPISIAVNAAGSGWQLYKSGVYTPWSFGPINTCNPNSLDHGVAIVGYGTDSGKDYWIIRNSWGASWGEEGYMRIVRGKNACGVANSASYPTV
jgi:C1A family cysteine protease